MADESRKEYEAALVRAAADVDYWYQTAQAICMRLVCDHLTVGELQKLLRQVEMDAACDFEPLHARGRSLNDLVSLTMFEGLRNVRDELRKRKGQADEG